MPSQNRRAAARRRAWGRGPIILRFEPLEGRQLLTTTAAAAATPPPPLPDLVGADFSTAHSLNWGNSFQAVGTVLNQGTATTTAPFNVEVFASSTPGIGAQSVPLGQITIPAGLAPGQVSQYNQVFSLPPTAIPNFAAGSPVYIATLVNPKRLVPESNYKNNSGVGTGYDISPVQIVPQEPSLLIGSALGTNPTATTWGQTVTVTAQIRNNAQGNAPATRARLVLTPAGLNPGSAYDYTIGYINVPAIAAFQTLNISQQITLPATAPSSLGGNTQYTLSMAQDVDFVTDPIFPHLANQGTGLDMTPLTIAASPTTPTATPTSTPTPTQTPTTLPDLAPSNVTTSAKTVYWGYDFTVNTMIQNLGQAASGPVEVMFLMTGANGSLQSSIFLGETTIPSLAPGSSQQLTQTVNLPSTLPSGVTLSSVGVGRVAVLVDPDHAIDETLRSNELAESPPITLRVLGTDGTSTVPTSPPIGTTLGQPQTAGSIQSTSTTATTTAGVVPAATTPKAPQPKTKATRKEPARPKKLQRRAPAPKESLTKKIEHQLKVFPSNFKNFVNDVIGNNSSKSKK